MRPNSPAEGEAPARISPNPGDSGRSKPCQDSAVGRVKWSVRQGRAGEFDAPELMNGYRSLNPVHEPKLGEILRLPDGSGPWLVVDWAVADRADAPGNVLVVEPFAA
jgi:hypothetical protein